MGRAARRKQDRQTPTPMPIQAGAFKDLQIAILRQQLIQRQAQDAVAEQAALVQTALKAAGLDPTKNYRLDAQRLTATKVPS